MGTLVGTAAEATTSILICTVPRSGSWLLAEALEDSGRCGHPREYFRADYEPIYCRAWEIAPPLHVSDYVAAVLRAATTPDGTAGVKFHWGQVAGLARRLRAEGGGGATDDMTIFSQLFPAPQYVHLVREDTAAQAVSLFRAIRSDVWWQLEPSPRQPSSPDRDGMPAFDEIARLERQLVADNACWTTFFSRHGIAPVRVRYEDLAACYAETVNAVLVALGREDAARPGISPPRLHRQADETSARWLAAYRAWRGGRSDSAPERLGAPACAPI